MSEMAIQALDFGAVHGEFSPEALGEPVVTLEGVITPHRKGFTPITWSETYSVGDVLAAAEMSQWDYTLTALPLGMLFLGPRGSEEVVIHGVQEFIAQAKGDMRRRFRRSDWVVPSLTAIPLGDNRFLLERRSWQVLPDFPRWRCWELSRELLGTVTIAPDEVD